MKRKKQRITHEEGTIFCAFCGRPEDEVERLIASGPMRMDAQVDIVLNTEKIASNLSGQVAFVTHICAECVATCSTILRNNKNGGADSSGPAKTQGETPHE